MTWNPSGDPVKDYEAYPNSQRSGLADLEQAGLSKPSIGARDQTQPSAGADLQPRRSREARPAIVYTTVGVAGLSFVLAGVSAGGPDWLFQTFAALGGLTILVCIVVAQLEKRR